MKKILLHIISCVCLCGIGIGDLCGQEAAGGKHTEASDTSSISLSTTDDKDLVKQAKEIQRERKKEERRKRTELKRQNIAERRAALIAQEDSASVAKGEIQDNLGEEAVIPENKPSYLDAQDTLLMPNMEYFAFDDSTMMAEAKILKAPPAKKEKNPAHAAFLSALIPGAGQIYGGSQWWMAPVFWGGMAGTICAVSWYNTYYNDFRAEYKYRIATGEMKDYTYFTNDALVERMQQAEKQRDLWILGTVGVYLLNVLHANVAVQLSEFKVQRKHREAIERDEIMKTLTFSPVMMAPAPGIDQNPTPGIGLTFSF